MVISILFQVLRENEFFIAENDSTFLTERNEFNCHSTEINRVLRQLKRSLNHP